MNNPYEKIDVVISTITRFYPKDIEPWVESLNRSGFTGKRMVVVYDVPQETINYLKQNHFDVFGSQLQHHLFNQRFRDTAIVLQNYECDRIIWTDIRDVIFQSNPTTWLNKYQEKPIIACSEAVKLGDDDWAQVCAGTSFKMEWNWLQHEESFCAGTILGDKEHIMDLFHNIFRWGITGENPAQAADQPAYNILIKQKQFKDIVQFVPQESALAVQMGTTYIKKDFFGDKLMEPTPLVLEDGTVTNQKGEPFCIVHQYDRDPKLKEVIQMKYERKIYNEPPRINEPRGFTYDEWKSIRSKGRYDTQYNEFLKDKRVVIVGPSPSLEGKGLGTFIDSYDIVIRMNKAFPIESDIQDDLGSRTDIHSHCLCTTIDCGGPVFYKEMKEQNVFVSCPYPKWVQPFYDDVTRFERDNKKWELPFHVIDTDYYISIAEMLGTRPNSGTMTILDTLAYDVKELYITGFTWFRDGWRKTYKDHVELFGEEIGTNKRQKELSGEFGGTHKQKPQEDLVREIYLKDDRVFIDDVMKEILKVE
jgi:hypothetical protein